MKKNLPEYKIKAPAEMRLFVINNLQGFNILTSLGMIEVDTV